jgi:hypothetical protein
VRGLMTSTRVRITDGFVKLSTDLARVDGLAEVDVDVGDLIVFGMGSDDLSRVVSRSGGRLGEDTNPNGDRTGDRFFNLALFFTLGVFFALRRFVDLQMMFTDAKGDGWGAEDMAEDALVEF